MHLIYFLADIFPFWAIPFALILFEAGRSFRRRGRTPQAIVLIIVSIVLATTSVLHILSGRDNVRKRLQMLEKEYSQTVSRTVNHS